MEGYLLPELGLRIKADPAFFCPLSQSLLLAPVDLTFGDKTVTVDRASLECWFRTVGKDVCPVSGVSISAWVIVKANVELRETIMTWARSQMLDLDAIEEAAIKLRKKGAFSRYSALSRYQACGADALRKSLSERKKEHLRPFQSCDVDMDWCVIDPISGKSTSLAAEESKDELDAIDRSRSIV